MDGRDPMISAFHVRPDRQSVDCGILIEYNSELLNFALPGLPNLLTRDWVTLNYTLSMSYRTVRLH